MKSSNEDFIKGISTTRITEAFSRGVRNDIDGFKLKGLPIARYDAKQKRAYLELPDGTREYVNG